MLHLSSDPSLDKEWLAAPWLDQPHLDIAIGCSHKGINEPHHHAKMREIYLVARGSSKAIVEDKEVALQAGDVLMVEPGEVHTFVDSSPDFMQFVVQSPFIVNDKFKV